MSEEKTMLMTVYHETLDKLNHQTKKYNLKTIHNLIFYFDEISESDKVRVYDEIYNYLFFIREVDISDSGRQSKLESNELYNRFIAPIITYYLPLGFSVRFAWSGLLFFAIFITPILIILNLTYYYYVVLYSIFLALRLWSYFKEKRFKVYGTLY